MKVLLKILAVIVGVYLTFWMGLAAYFSIAERHKGLLESTLSGIFDRSVEIQSIETAWSGLSPAIRISGFKVEGDTAEQPALSFDSLSAEFSMGSILGLWPKLTEFAIDHPVLEIVSLPGNKLRVAGITLTPKRSSVVNPKRFISWLLNHQSAAWLDGKVIWRQLNGQNQYYSDISIVYQREGENRQVSAATMTPKGPLAFKAESNGDVLGSKNWNADLQLLGDKGQRLLAPDDLSLKVQNGKGKFSLKTLDMERVRDFLLLTGLGEAASWILDAQLSGRLHDVDFTFSGALLDFDDWALEALASEIGFKATDKTPAMSDLAGEVQASSAGGNFRFAADAAVFSWPRWFEDDFAIEQAAGQFSWILETPGKINIALQDGVFEDSVVNIWDINANFTIDVRSRDVTSFAELFSLDSVSNLDYQEGKLIDNSESRLATRPPPYLDARAQYEIKSLANVIRYIPRDSRVDKLREWWGNAFTAGIAQQGLISYQGDVSKVALKEQKARLSSSASFSGVTIDYGYERDWPKLNRAEGTATLENELLTILPEKAWLKEDKLENAKLTISSLLHVDRQLDLSASMQTSLPRVMQFLFDGPLLQPELRGKPLPIIAKSGRVNADVSVSIPLRNVVDTTVAGVAEITQGHFILPQGVPIKNASAKVHFTERSVESENIKATFLNGPASAELLTIQETQPPVLQVRGIGAGDLQFLQPWLGEHVLSLMQGSTEWEGVVDIDGPIIDIQVNSDLRGVVLDAPAPLGKKAKENVPLSLAMRLGGQNLSQELAFVYGEHLSARLAGDPIEKNSFFDSGMFRISQQKLPVITQLKTGINLEIDYDQIDLDSWFSTIIDIAQLKTESKPGDTAFLDALRTVKIQAQDPKFLGRQFGALSLSAVSVDGAYWIGTLNGDNVNGTLQAEPRLGVGKYGFNLSRLHLIEAQDSTKFVAPIDNSLRPSSYPIINLSANSFQISGKPFGRLEMAGAPNNDKWELTKFKMDDQGILTTATGGWVNNSEQGSLTSINIETKIEEAGDVLDEMDFAGVLKKGSGYFNAKVNWIGAPHEFDFARLNGEFDMRIADGELVKVEPGGGKLLGLLNFNAIARRLTLDFRDIFSTGMQFDRMHYAGLFADGEAIMQDAYVLTPSVFLKLEGKLDLKKELVDLEIHAAPELAGNLTLLSALANPAAGAVVFLTQQIFKDQMRASSFKSYRALGTWDDFEIEDIAQGAAVQATNKK